jgi:LuxR family maltose regulon positive regulatory protein
VDGAGPTETGLLTRAELRVLALLPTHLSLAQIGDELVISRNTVKSQVAAIYRKLDAVNRGDAVRRAREAGLLDPPDRRSSS